MEDEVQFLLNYVTNREYIVKVQIELKLLNLTDYFFRGKEEFSIVLFLF